MRGVLDLMGVTLKGLVLEDRLGGSSHTAVYRASGRDGKELAVKIVDSQLEPESGLSERLRRDASVLSDLSHPHILSIEDAGWADNMTFAVSPMVRGWTLHDIMSQGQLDNEVAWRILTQIADALDSVHYRGLVYRLLKPVNVLVGDGVHVSLAEFGVASQRVGPMALATPGYRLVGPQYLAPEQVEGVEPDWRADIYALAVLVFEILTGTPLLPLGRSLSETLQTTLLGQPPSAQARQPALPPGVDEVLFRAMARDPQDRYITAWELLDALVNVADDGAPTPVALPSPGAPAVQVVEPVAAVPVPAVTAGARVEQPQSSMVGLLHRLGVPLFESRRQLILNSYFAALVRFARDVCGERWKEVLQVAGLPELLTGDPADDEDRNTPVASPARLAEAIELVMGPAAPETMRRWGRLTGEFWIRKTQQLQEGSVTYMRPLRLMAGGDQKVEDVLYIVSRNLDRVRGERLTAWKRVDKHQFWIVHYDNLMVVGRRTPATSCYFWTSALESATRWGGLANDWVVDEAECGSVTGTCDCIFTIKRISR